MKRITLTLAMAVMLTVALLAPATAGPKSIGKTTLDTDVAAGINYGTGIPDGEWLVAEIQGVEIGLRATDRTDGLLDVSGTNGNRVGVYQASTGLETSTRAEWNYEFHVDLSGAKGNARNRTLEDYTLALEQDFYPGVEVFPLPMPDVCDNTVDVETLCQQSWNPTFFGAVDAGYNPAAEETYTIRLILTPETFNGPSIAAEIRVEVTDPA